VSELLRTVADFRAVNEETRTIDVVASTDALDSHGTILEQKWDLTRYLQNPVVLWAHNSGLGTPEPPIGFASDVRVENGQLKATVTLVDEKASALAEKVWQGVKQKSIRGLSVGFRSKTTRVEKRDDKEIVILTDNTLFEISLVPVPSNPDTLAAMRSLALESSHAAETSKTTAHMGTQETTNMRNVAKALGLSEDASEADVLARIAVLNTQTRTLDVHRSAIDELTGKTGSESVGTVRGWKDEAARAGELARRAAELEAAAVLRSVEAMLDAKIAEGYVEPAKRASLLKIGMRDVEDLRSYLAECKTKIVKIGDAPPELRSPGDGADVTTVTDEDRTLAKAFGTTVESVLADKKRAAESKRVA